ncbi:ABC transporter ATP-binding protein [Chitinophaga horti]|uniref:ABC transporter ATP-binding protein n=1 Tax=Chitinophaga horti TaxID=2920382 RepID=A0ABY6IXV8_9BACT|nr:ABC transporter ATP-binding protein [Chitinophaga horti]UYQ90971.1 ABC transporter ATP-binding protein [Chitinophaga horti]
MLQITELNKTYGDHQALRGLNLTVNKGEVFCLLGQNGAGKTTTINIALGFLPATSGSVAIDGWQVTPGGSNASKSVAYIPEVVMLYANLTAIENLDFFSQLAGYSYSKAELQSFLTDANLQADAHHKRVGTFSKGMRQKVGIAIAIAKNASVILMDEPTSGLDPRATDEFTRIVKNLAAQGKSVLIATHDIFNAVNIGTHIGIMKNGQLLHVVNAADITPDALQRLYLETI